MAVLRGLGADDDAEQVYRALVRHGPQTVQELREQTGLDPDTADAVVVTLGRLGLVEVHGHDLVPLPPRTALEGLADRRSREATAARRAADELGSLWTARHDPEPSVQLLTTTASVQALVTTLLRSAAVEVVALSVGPVGTVEKPPAVAPGVLETLGRGVSVRVVYGSQVLHSPLGIAVVRECLEHGEQARVFPDVPVNLMITEAGAVLVAEGQRGERLHGLAVRPSDFLTRLRGIFTSFWDMGVPLAADLGTIDDSELRASTRELLTCLAAGLTDDSIAQKLGVSPRTVGRRIAQLQDVLGARSRFQLGVQAIRRGWL